MSIIPESTRSSRVSSILKTPSIKSKLNATRTPTKVRFQLPHAKKVRTILQDYVKGENVRDFETLVILIRDAELLDKDVRELLHEATCCISLLNQDLRLFVEAILSLKWADRSEEIVSEYESFLLNLLCAHNYHAKYAIDKLVSNLLPDSEDEEDWPNGTPSVEDCNKCASIHWVFNVLLKVVPMCRELLMQSLINQYPYFKKPSHVHEYYLHNLLWMLDYQPQFRPDIFHLIFSKMVLLDVNAPREEIEKAEYECDQQHDVFDIDDELKSVKCTSDKLRHPIGHTLDICMDKIFTYCLIDCHEIDTNNLDWDKTKRLYHELITIFDKIILPTYNIHHVQFLMFIICSLKSGITEAFLNYLWKKVCTPNIASVIRQSSVAYIASLIARSSFVPLFMLKGTLQQMAEWIHSYISTQDGLECVNSDVRVHTVFYSVCQALFYVIAFRQKDLVDKKRNITFLESLNLSKIVTSRLNPLRVCQPAIVQNFAALTRTYQLAYCYSVMEHNLRNSMPTIYHDERGTVLTSNNILDSFFPFDPYVLKRSGEKIYPFYLNYQDVDDQQPQKYKDFEDDDFLVDHGMPGNSTKSLDKFSYGSSPGFKLKG